MAGTWWVIGAANQAIAQLAPEGRPDPLPEGLRLYDLRHTAASLMIRWPLLHGPSADQRSCPSGKALVNEGFGGCRRRGSNPHALWAQRF